MSIMSSTKLSNNFDFNQIKNKSPSECKSYIKQYFIPLTDGSHIVFVNGKYTIYDQATIKKTYFDRMPVIKDEDGDEKFNISKWYFTKYTNIRTISYELNKPIFYDDKINLCPNMLHKYKPFKDFDDAIKAKVSIMQNYILEVLASGNQDQYDYIVKWFSYMVKGNKNQSILYLRGGQGIGKSTLFEYIRKFVIGNELSLVTGSEPIVSRFNARLAGKLFVTFEELETFTTAQWMAVSSRLKRFATCSTIELEDKNIKAYEAQNLNNYAVLSNNDCIKDDDGRRYFILDIATHREIIKGSKNEAENRKYWDDVHTCDNNDVGSAFYSYLMEVDTDNYDSQNFPVTQSKLDSFAKRLDTHEAFLKHKYILTKLEIKCTVGELYDEYVTYCKSNELKASSKIDLNKKLKELNIVSYKSDKCNKFKVSIETLEEIASTRKWVHETDEYFEDSNNEKKSGFIDDYYSLNGVHPETKIDELEKDLREEKKQHVELSIKYDDMKAQFDELKKKLELLEISRPKVRLIEDSDDEEPTEISLSENKRVCIEGLKFLDIEIPKPQIIELDLEEMIENALEGKLIQVSDETIEKIIKKM